MTDVVLDSGAIAALAAPGGAVDVDMRRRATNVLNRAVLGAPVDTGRLRASGFVTEIPGVPAGYDVVFPVDYAYYVDQGTVYMEGRPFLSGVLVVALE